jgi:hypothetical membrane protein
VTRSPELARRLALAGIVGPAAFAAAAIIGAQVNDGYSQMHSFISELAAEGSQARVLMTIGFFALGLCVVVFAWSVRVLRPAAAALALVIAFSGAGVLMAGTFSCDEGCPAQGVTSTHQDLHNVSSIITFSSWIIAPLLAGWQLRNTDSRLARLSIAFGVVELAVALWLQTYSTDRQPDDPVGLLQRVILLVIFTWLVVTALELRRGWIAQRDTAVWVRRGRSRLR